MYKNKPFFRIPVQFHCSRTVIDQLIQYITRKTVSIMS